MPQLPYMLANCYPVPRQFFFRSATFEAMVPDPTHLDASGNPIEVPQLIFSDLPVAAVPLDPREMTEWEQRGVKTSLKVYLRHDDAGNLPYVPSGARMTMGKHPDGTPRYLTVKFSHDEAEAGLLRTLYVDEIPPGGQ